MESERGKRMELENMLKEFLKSKNFQEEELLRENYKLRQEVGLLREEVKIYATQERLGQDRVGMGVGLSK